MVAGLNFGPYIDGQDPNLGAQVDAAQLMARMELIRPYTAWIRSFGSTNGLEETGAIAHSLALKAAVGAWISDDLVANERELQNLIAAGQAGEADTLIVGSEVLLRGDLSEDTLIDYINRVKQAVPGVPVTYADAYDVLLAHPAILDAVDIVYVNYYPYWQGLPIDLAVAAIHDWHAQVTAAAAGKQVVVSETGWPSNGESVGRAVPSAENAAFFFQNFVSWARANSVEYFYFEAYDETWKADYEGPQGAHWGVWDKDGNLKPGMEVVFEGETLADNWSATGLPGGPGEPVIEFTHVPAFGSFDDLEGQALHVEPAEYRVAVYIYVGGWWTKPTFARPLTPIQIDGSWITDITTGGVDQNATRIAAFLLPEGYNPPRMSGGSTLPAELAETAVASVEVSRSR
jgi:exo-beta-1,3-glucanase (GH17 family)